MRSSRRSVEEKHVPEGRRWSYVSMDMIKEVCARNVLMFEPKNSIRTWFTKQLGDVSTIFMIV